MSAKKELLEALEELTKEGEAISNELRLLILATVALKREAQWYEIKEVLSKIVGSVNPNAMAFHINRLSDLGFVGRKGSQRAPKYFVKKLPRNVEPLIKLLEAALEES